MAPIYGGGLSESVREMSSVPISRDPHCGGSGNHSKTAEAGSASLEGERFCASSATRISKAQRCKRALHMSPPLQGRGGKSQMDKGPRMWGGACTPRKTCSRYCVQQVLKKQQCCERIQPAFDEPGGNSDCRLARPAPAHLEASTKPVKHWLQEGAVRQH